MLALWRALRDVEHNRRSVGMSVDAAPVDTVYHTLLTAGIYPRYFCDIDHNSRFSL